MNDSGKGVSFFKECEPGYPESRGSDGVSNRVPRTQPSEPQGSANEVSFYKECEPGNSTQKGSSDFGHRAFDTDKRFGEDPVTHYQGGKGVISPDLEGNVGDAHGGSSHVNTN
jgi:hypothetical protein